MPADRSLVRPGRGGRSALRSPGVADEDEGFVTFGHDHHRGIVERRPGGSLALIG
jgi:hypothetical protein